MKPSAWLLDFASNTHSQSGEDGVIGRILDMLSARDRWCVEFGAWDGSHLSNTRKLIETDGYSAVLIEASPERFLDLQASSREFPNVIPIQAFVGFGPADGLDAILARLPIPLDFDLLSCDVDGNDYHIWAAITKYRPKVVCIEFNPTIPTEVRFTQPADPAINQGASLAALTDLGRLKGYELVSVLPFNAIFVDAKYFSLFEIADNRPESLRRDTSAVTWLFCGYDGTIHLSGAGRMPWHGLAYDEARLQLLPKILRTYPENYSRLQRRLLRLLTWWRS
jgi:hypothetical protein